MSNDLEKSSTKERCPKCFNDRVTRVQGDPPYMRHCEGCGYDWDQSAVAQVMREALERRPFPKLGLTLNEGMPNSITGEVPVRMDDGGAFLPDLEGEARRKNADELLVSAMRRLEEANARIEREVARGDEWRADYAKLSTRVEHAVELLKAMEKERLSYGQERDYGEVVEILTAPAEESSAYDANIHPETPVSEGEVTCKMIFHPAALGNPIE